MLIHITENRFMSSSRFLVVCVTESVSACHLCAICFTSGIEDTAALLFNDGQFETRVTSNQIHPPRYRLEIFYISVRHHMVYCPRLCCCIKYNRQKPLEVFRFHSYVCDDIYFSLNAQTFHCTENYPPIRIM